MDRIITTSISDPTTQQPFTGRSLDFLQNASKDVALALALEMIGDSYDNTKAYVLKGVHAYGTNQYTDGYILWSGEIYYTSGKSTTTAFTNVPVMTITVTNDATADPVTFSDGVSRNVHNNRDLVLSDAVSGSGTFDLGDAIYVVKFKSASTPTLSALTTLDVAVGGGVTMVGTPSYYWLKTNTGFKLYFRSLDISTTATTAKIRITLPFSVPTISGNANLAQGISPVRFYKSGTGNVSCYVWILLSSSGTGTELTIEKSDGTAFGVLNNYEVTFAIDINYIHL